MKPSHETEAGLSIEDKLYIIEKFYEREAYLTGWNETEIKRRLRELREDASELNQVYRAAIGSYDRDWMKYRFN